MSDRKPAQSPSSLRSTLGLAVTVGTVVLLGAAFFFSGASKGRVEYDVIDLLDAGEPTCAVSINDKGQILIWENRHVDHVITYGEHPMEMKAWVREPDGRLIAIPGLGGKWVHPREISGGGTVIGEAATSDGKAHGFIWDGSGQPRDLGELGFDLPYAEIHSLNDRGEMGGTYFKPLSGSRFSEVPRIWDFEGEVRQTFEEGNRVVDLNNAGAALIDFGESWQGEVVSATGERVSVGELAHQGSRPLGMNDRGEVVGYSSITSTFQGTLDGVWGAIKSRRASIQWEARPHAFLWREGKMTDLNARIDPESGWELLWAFGINNGGEIVGGGKKDGEVRAFLLKPVDTSN
jgi:probable HAF family extracellular repeat protein